MKITIWWWNGSWHICKKPQGPETECKETSFLSQISSSLRQILGVCYFLPRFFILSRRSRSVPSLGCLRKRLGQRSALGFIGDVVCQILIEKRPAPKDRIDSWWLVFCWEKGPMSLSWLIWLWQEIEDLKWPLPQSNVVHEAPTHGSPCFVFEDS